MCEGRPVVPVNGGRPGARRRPCSSTVGVTYFRRTPSSAPERSWTDSTPASRIAAGRWQRTMVSARFAITQPAPSRLCSRKRGRSLTPDPPELPRRDGRSRPACHILAGRHSGCGLLRRPAARPRRRTVPPPPGGSLVTGDAGGSGTRAGRWGQAWSLDGRWGFQIGSSPGKSMRKECARAGWGE